MPPNCSRWPTGRSAAPTSPHSLSSTIASARFPGPGPTAGERQTRRLPDPDRVKLVRGGLGVDQVGAAGQYAGVGDRQDAEAEVEHVALRRTALREDLAGAGLAHVPRREQADRVQVALERLARVDPVYGVVQGHTPVDAHHV